MTDLRDLCARMADELDRYRQYLMDDRSEVHALAAEARAALVESKSIEDRIAEADAAIEASMERVRRIASMPAREIAAEFRARAVLARWGNRQEMLDSSPADREVAELVAWLLDEAIQAADASQPKAAGMLTWAAQLVGEHHD